MPERKGINLFGKQILDDFGNGVESFIACLLQWVILNCGKYGSLSTSLESVQLYNLLGRAASLFSAISIATLLYLKEKKAPRLY